MNLFIIQKSIQFKYHNQPTTEVVERPALILNSKDGNLVLGILKSKQLVQLFYESLLSPGTVVRLIQTSDPPPPPSSSHSFIFPFDVESHLQDLSLEKHTKLYLIHDLEIMSSPTPFSSSSSPLSLKRKESPNINVDSQPNTETNSSPKKAKSDLDFVFLDDLDANSNRYSCLVRVIKYCRSVFMSKTRGEMVSYRLLLQDAKRNVIQATLWDDQTGMFYSKWFKVGQCLVMHNAKLRHLDDNGLKYNKGTLPYSLELPPVESQNTINKSKSQNEGDEIVEDSEEEEEEEEEKQQKQPLFEFYSEVRNVLRLEIPPTFVEFKKEKEKENVQKMKLHSILDISELEAKSEINLIGYVVNIHDIESGQSQATKKEWSKRKIDFFQINQKQPFGKLMTIWSPHSSHPLWSHPEFLKMIHQSSQEEEKNQDDADEKQNEIRNLSQKPLVCFHQMVVNQQKDYPKEIQSGYETSISWYNPEYLSNPDFFFPALHPIVKEAQIYDLEMKNADDPNNHSLEHIPTPISLPPVPESQPKNCYQANRSTLKQLVQREIQSRKFRSVSCRVSNISFSDVNSLFIFQCECFKGFLNFQEETFTYKCSKCGKEFNSVEHLNRKFRLEAAFQDESTIQVIRVYEDLACKLIGFEKEKLDTLWDGILHKDQKMKEKILQLFDQSYKKRWIAMFQCDRAANYNPSDPSSPKVWLTIKTLDEINFKLEFEHLNSSIHGLLNDF